MQRDCTISPTHAPTIFVEDLAATYLITTNIEVYYLNIEESQNLIKTYYAYYDHDPSDAEVKGHLMRGAHLQVVNWLKPFNIFQDDDISLKRVTLVKSDDARKYGCVESKILGIPSILSDPSWVLLVGEASYL